jgi:hypothetical protein
MSTVPAAPSTVMVVQVAMVSEALMHDITHGIPSSRLTIAAWLITAPTSTTTAAAETNSGVHDGSVRGATGISPGSRSSASPGSWMTRATPVTTPAHAGTLCRTAPGSAAACKAASRRAQRSYTMLRAAGWVQRNYADIKSCWRTKDLDVHRC